MSSAVIRSVPHHAQDFPGVVIDHSPADSRVYVGSPSLVPWNDHVYIATHDFFGAGSTWDQTLVFRSEDAGKSWKKVCRISGQWWSTLFVHRSALYLMGTSREHGLVTIRRSDDQGTTWTDPRCEKTGVLRATGEFHTAPVPVTIHRGRIWRAMEDASRGTDWPRRYSPFMMSAPVDADLLAADSWLSSHILPSESHWHRDQFAGWLEGNAVAAPTGEMVDILRVHQPDSAEIAAMAHVSADGARLSFDPHRDLIQFPGGTKKFTIRHDPISNLYWSLVNPVLPDDQNRATPDCIRNTLALSSSPDLRQWTIRKTVLHHADVGHHGFQYADWQFSGDDIIAASRTAWEDSTGPAHSAHDANYLTFHRIKKFRND